jgi:uncharacterized protein (DUF1810 family)
MQYNLQRFLDAQEHMIDNAILELFDGKKKTHWMWYIFPQLHGLGHSEMSKRYGIHGRAECEAYLREPTLKARLLGSCSILLLNKGRKSVYDILGECDAEKLRSSMTLFHLVSPANHTIFWDIIEDFFDGEICRDTQEMLTNDPGGEDISQDSLQNTPAKPPIVKIRDHPPLIQIMTNLLYFEQ